jgi:hypothetical protein
MDSKHKDRVDAWRQDTELVVHKHIFGNWSVRGNVTKFFYKLDMDEDKANAYAAELNKNKSDEQFTTVDARHNESCFQD